MPHESAKRKKLLLIDGHGLAFRAFFALPALNAPDGTPTNAVVGFFNMFRKILDDWGPDLSVVAFDAPGPTFRHKSYEEYKANRPPTPQDFKVQPPLIMDLLHALGVPVVVREGVEADDVIASLACTAREHGMETLIVSSDKDLLQVIAPGISILRPHKGITTFQLLDERAFRTEFGFPPPAMKDYLALVGDASDNVPGVPGVGDKTARDLVGTYGSLEDIYENMAVLKPGVQKRLSEGKSAAYHSRELVTLLCDMEENVEDYRPGDPDGARFSELCRALGLQKLEEKFRPPSTGEQPFAKSVPPAAFHRLVPLEEVLHEPKVACHFGEESECVLRAEDGRYALFPREELTGVLEHLRDSTVLLWDYKDTLSSREGVPLSPLNVRDFTTAHYLLHPDGRTHDPEVLFPDFGAMAVHQKAAKLQEEYGALTRRIAEYDGLSSVMAELDIPLVPVLVDMERWGICCNLDAYAELERDLASRIAEIEEEIARIGGERINLNSPKQVGWLLFEKLGLPVGKKTKTGYSTDVTVLEGLVAMGRPYDEVPSLLLEHRELSKMLSGFVQPLTRAAKAGNGIIHGTFEPAVTGTGRLSSRDPNLQNLPSFGEWSHRIKAGLTPRGEGRVFVSADYSQIELRVLAHLSGEERLVEAFREGRDIHGETASWVFSIEPSLVTPELRRVAKMINFGLLYGMSSFGLAQRLAMGRQEAASIIRRYFAALPSVEAYLEESYEEAKRRGYTTTVAGRIRPLDEVPVSPRDRDGLRRVAVNTPLQGTAADIARKAMVDFSAEFPASGDTHLVLQIHDSLVCECPAKKADTVLETLSRVMEKAADLSVPLKVESKKGKTLAEV